MHPKIKTLMVLKGKERKRVLNSLKESFGVENIPGILVKRGKEKLFLYSGDFEEKDFFEISKFCFIERAGLYFAKDEGGKIRLSIEGSQILKDQFKKNIVELNKEEMERWMRGYEVLKKTGFRGLVVMKYRKDFLGTGKASEEKITNFIPRSRRLRDRKVEK